MIFCSTISFITTKHHFGKRKSECGRFKAKNLYHGVGIFWDLSGEVVVYRFALIYTKKLQKSNHRNLRFFTLKIVNRNKIGLSS